MGKIANEDNKIYVNMLYGNYCYIFIENFPQKFSPCKLDGDHCKSDGDYFKVDCGHFKVDGVHLEVNGDHFEVYDDHFRVHGDQCSVVIPRL